MNPLYAYRKKPVVIEAVRWHGDNEDDMSAFLREGSGGCEVGRIERGCPIHIRTLEGVMRAEVGDWIIRGLKGELYPCKPDIFAASYEPATP